MDPTEYKHVVLGLIFLKYISDAFEERHQELLAEVGEGADREDPDEYRADNVFSVSAATRWQAPLGNAKQPMIGKRIDVIGTIGRVESTIRAAARRRLFDL